MWRTEEAVYSLQRVIWSAISSRVTWSATRGRLACERRHRPRQSSTGDLVPRLARATRVRLTTLFGAVASILKLIHVLVLGHELHGKA